MSALGLTPEYCLLPPFLENLDPPPATANTGNVGQVISNRGLFSLENTQHIQAK